MSSHGTAFWALGRPCRSATSPPALKRATLYLEPLMLSFVSLRGPSMPSLMGSGLRLTGVAFPLCPLPLATWLADSRAVCAKSGEIGNSTVPSLDFQSGTWRTTCVGFATRPPMAHVHSATSKMTRHGGRQREPTRAILQSWQVVGVLFLPCFSMCEAFDWRAS